jgi:O-antigen ligase
VRVLLAGCAIVCVWALGLSQTRTSALVALALVALALIAALLRGRPRGLAGAIALIGVIGGLGLAVALLHSAVSRLTTREPPHVGLNFRREEVESFLRLPTRAKVLGQGFGGHFVGRDVNGHSANSGWAHELPVWIALKAGIPGLLGAGLALVILAMRAVRALRCAVDRRVVLAGGVLVLGLIAMSITLDRLALPEGTTLFTIGVFLISAPLRGTVRRS